METKYWKIIDGTLCGFNDDGKQFSCFTAWLGHNPMGLSIAQMRQLRKHGVCQG